MTLFRKMKEKSKFTVTKGIKRMENQIISKMKKTYLIGK